LLSGLFFWTLLWGRDSHPKASKGEHLEITKAGLFLQTGYLPVTQPTVSKHKWETKEMKE